MIRILGTKRILFLFVLVTLNALLGGLIYGYLWPEKERAERELRTVRGQISTLQSDIDRMQVEFDQIEDQKSRFEQLKAAGFFRSQGRREAEDIFQKIQEQSGVISAVANLQAGKIEKSEEARKAEHEILQSPVSIKISALDDIEVYRYIYLVEQFFPGHVSIDAIVMKRDSVLNGTILRSIASGANPPLVRADMELTWRTMLPASQLAGLEGN